MAADDDVGPRATRESGAAAATYLADMFGIGSGHAVDLADALACLPATKLDYAVDLLSGLLCNRPRDNVNECIGSYIFWVRAGNFAKLSQARA